MLVYFPRLEILKGSYIWPTSGESGGEGDGYRVRKLGEEEGGG